MSETHASHEPHVDVNAFTDSEWQQLRQVDFYAAYHVVGLMLSIFVMGIILYSIVSGSIIVDQHLEYPAVWVK